jgi:hypothetical protein
MFRIHQILLLGFAAGVLHGQTTQLDLRFQSRDVDFSTANATKPFKSGTTFPSVCAVGEMFFKIDGPAGANLYGCTALNSWSLESTSGGGAGASMASQLGDFAVTRTSATVLTIGTSCSASTPCQVRFENVVYAVLVGPATLTISAGSAPAYIYVTSAGALTCASASDTLLGSGCTVVTGSAFPSDSVPIFVWTATTGTWDASGGTDNRALLSTQVNLPGAGVNVTHASGKDTFSVDSSYINSLGYVQLSPVGAAVQTMASGATLEANPSANKVGFRTICGTPPSTPTAGGQICNTEGDFGTWGGSSWNWPVVYQDTGSNLNHPTVVANQVFGTGSAAGVPGPMAMVVTQLAVFARYISRQAAGCNNAAASASLDLPTTNAPTPTCHGTTYTWGTLDFDHATAKKASFSFRLPLGWTGNIDVGLDWFTSAITNTNKWTIESACLVEGTTDATAPSFNTAQTITTTSNGTTNVLTRSAQAAITTTGCAAGNIIILRVGRDVTDTNTSTDSLRNIDVTLRVTPQA